MKGTIIVDTKESIWYRQYFRLDEEITVEEFINGVESGEIESDHDEILYETAHTMTPEENEGEATMEIYQDSISDNNLIYTNKEND